MALSDEKFYLILEMVALVGVMVVVIVEATVFCRISLRHVLSDRWRPSVRSIVYCSLKYLSLCTYQSRVVSELRLVL